MSTRVRIIGTGLIGTSLGIALSRRGFAVCLDDPSPTARRLARDLGAGSLAEEEQDDPDLVVVAAPPDVTAAVVVAALAAWPDAVVTDVSSVKSAIALDVAARGGDLSRYVGSHPMAGRERAGAGAARADLFEGRMWVVVPTDASRPEAVEAVKGIARAAGSAVTVMDSEAHDRAVAAISHLPQVVASLVAGQLRGVEDEALSLAGQGLRDVTRIAASDPRLWTQILAGNAAAIRDALTQLHGHLGEVVGALDALAAGNGQGSLEVLNRTIQDGNAGRSRIPGKHGAAPTAYRTVTVLVPDQPGSVGRLLMDIGDAGVNMEDIQIEHGIGMPYGLADIQVVPAAVDTLLDVLARKGWRVHD